jgi:hypothetical protein
MSEEDQAGVAERRRQTTSVRSSVAERRRYARDVRSDVAERHRRSICVTAGETRSGGVPHALNPEVGSTPACGVGVRSCVVERRRRSICVTVGETRSIGVPHALNPEVGSTPTGVVVRGDVTTPSCASLRSTCMGLRKFNASGVRLCGFVVLLTDFVIFISGFDISLSE